MNIAPFVALCALMVFALYFLQGKETDAQKLDKILDEAAAAPPFEDDQPFRYKTKQAQVLADLWGISDKEVMQPVNIWGLH